MGGGKGRAGDNREQVGTACVLQGCRAGNVDVCMCVWVPARTLQAGGQGAASRPWGMGDGGCGAGAEHKGWSCHTGDDKRQLGHAGAVCGAGLSLGWAPHTPMRPSSTHGSISESRSAYVWAGRELVNDGTSRGHGTTPPVNEGLGGGFDLGSPRPAASGQPSPAGPPALACQDWLVAGRHGLCLAAAGAASRHRRPPRTSETAPAARGRQAHLGQGDALQDPELDGDLHGSDGVASLLAEGGGMMMISGTSSLLRLSENVTLWWW